MDGIDRWRDVVRGLSAEATIIYDYVTGLYMIVFIDHCQKNLYLYKALTKWI